MRFAVLLAVLLFFLFNIVKSEKDLRIVNGTEDVEEVNKHIQLSLFDRLCEIVPAIFVYILTCVFVFYCCLPFFCCGTICLLIHPNLDSAGSYADLGDMDSFNNKSESSVTIIEESAVCISIPELDIIKEPGVHNV